ncbi:unnamed protein product [Bursaphelenchus xylophilus]|uniref:(pine wood nematode) hypothetical protein n=1 Tax=Bursaphelenchus xylophilus TaxID=6326 RepID=A0A1I7SGT4_BURXY|nr:unnamed protein product [Bursaphelenchus xylophilus]CAG9080853.1 unnamed protein product [Bursaphelenchus xylophilus]
MRVVVILLLCVSLSFCARLTHRQYCEETIKKALNGIKRQPERVEAVKQHHINFVVTRFNQAGRKIFVPFACMNDMVTCIGSGTQMDSHCCFQCSQDPIP